MAQERPIDVKVLVLNFDPIVRSEGGKRLHVVGKWNDPRKLADGYMGDLREASKGLLRHRIVEWRDLDVYPVKTDGYQYDEDMYMACMKAWKGWHEPDGLDYYRAISDNKVEQAIDSGKADELWIFGAPYFGFWESAMAGPRSFYINGGVYEKAKTKKPFAIMGFNYERGVAEMLHNLCHRTEATMTRISGGWRADELTTPWARFGANDRQSNGIAAVGTCHWPPNAEKDYDYANERTVMSSADDYLNYPKLTGQKKPVNRETWGGPDYHRNYMKWWFARLPRAPGQSAEGLLHNWWRYVYEFDQYDDRGRTRR